MLYIKKFIANPLEWITGFFGLSTVFFITQTYPIFAKAKYTFTQMGFVNIVGLIVCIIVTFVLVVLSLNNYKNKTIEEIKTLKLENSNKINLLKQKDENAKGLLQTRTELKNEIMDNRATIDGLKTQVSMYSEAFKVLLSKSDGSSIAEIDTKIIPLIPETTNSKEKEKQNDR